jgi:hypothetical protein
MRGKKVTTNEFVEKSKKVHGKKYDYSKVNYVSIRHKVEIICPKHGSFFTSPECHLLKKSNCMLCYREGRRNSIEHFIKKSRKFHGNKYNYSKSRYKSAHEKIKIICPIHGEFNQTPHIHSNGSGCPKCVGRNKTTIELIRDFKQIHDDRYDYSKVNYIGNKTKIEIICVEHGKFWQTPNGHLSGYGCPKCINIISKSEIEFLNYLKIPDTKENRQIRILRKKVDGFDPKTNTIYEFLGDYWHGNPKKFKHDDINERCKKPFGELYEKTFNRLNELKNLGYKVYYIWESNWKLWLKNPATQLPITEY